MVRFARKRRFRRRHGKKKGKSLASKVYKLARIVNRRRPEIKHYTVSSNVANVYSTTSQGLNLVGAMAQAPGGSGRIGDSIFVKSIKMKLRFVQPSAVGCDRESIGARAIMSRAKQQTFNTAIDETYLLSDISQWQSLCPNPDWTSKVDILADRTKITHLAYGITTDFPEVYMTINKTINKTVTWAQDSDDLVKNGLYLELFSNQSNYPLTCYYQYDITYTDA